MNEQDDLFSRLTGQSPQPWRNSDPVTSQEAGSAASAFKSDHQRMIYREIAGSKWPLAAEQIADRLGWQSHVPVNRRLSELVDAGMIKVVDHAHKNRGSNRSAQRYAVAGTPE